MKIGIISENYFYDSTAYKNLLSKYTFKKGQRTLKVSFVPICKNVEGNNILTPKAVKTINAECQQKEINFVILAKDSDGLPSEEKKILELTNKIERIAKQTVPTIIPFLVIFEQEALILADIQTFNKIYSTKSTFSKNPKFQAEPKEFLKHLTNKSKRKFKESDTPEIFQQLDFNKVYQKHKGDNSFQSFIDELESVIA